MKSLQLKKLMMLMILIPLLCGGEINYSNFFPITSWQNVVDNINGTKYVSFYYDNLSYYTNPGEPMLPSKRLTFIVPKDATNFKINATNIITSDSTINDYVTPTLQQRYRSDNLKNNDIIMSPSIYRSNAFFPSEPCSLSGEGYYMGEYHLISVDVYPMQYNPITKTLRRNTKIDFSISYELGKTKVNNIITRNSTLYSSEEYSDLESIVANKEDLKKIFSSRVLTTNFRDSLELGDAGGEINPIQTYPEYNYLIVVTDSLKDYVKRIAALKRQKGYSVGIKTLSDIINDASVANGDKRPLLNGDYTYINDYAGKLREYLRNAFTNNETQYVLFAGADIPFRKGYFYLEDEHDISQFSIYKYSRESIPTDWYFCELNTNWKIDKDSRYAEKNEYEHDHVEEPFDMAPELYVGRLMFENHNEINNYTNKLLRYELNPGNGDTSYLGRAIEASNGNIDININYNYAESMREKWSEVFSQTDLHYIEKDSVSPDAHDLIMQINNTKYGMMCIEGHGTPENIFTNNLGDYQYCILPYESMVPNEHYASWEQMNSRYTPGILYAISCTTTPFDNWKEYSENEYFLKQYNLQHLGNSFTLGNKYGGVAYIGYTRPSSLGSFVSGSPKLAQRFMECLTEGKYNIGKAEAISKMYFTNIIDTDVFGNNLIGDPEFEVWTSELSPINGVTIQRFNNSIKISGINADGGKSIVSYCNNLGQGHITTYRNAVTLSNTNPNSIIMIRRHDKLPYISQLILQNTTIAKSQYVIAKGVYAGSNVDENRINGNVIIKNGANYEVEFTESVNLMPGFEVQLGASFSAEPSEY